MMGRAFRQVYRGRVVSPAKFINTNNSTFVSFTIAVDNLVDGKETGFINCSYWPARDRSPEEDLVAMSLAWITTDQQQGLVIPNIGPYKSVEVTVEGQMTLKRSEGEKGYFVNLRYVNVDIHNNDIVQAVKAALGIGSSNNAATAQQSSAPVVQVPNTAPVQVPNVAPVAAAVPQPVSAPVQQQPQQATSQPPEGSFLETAEGDVYKVVDGQYVFVAKANKAPNGQAAPQTAVPQVAPTQTANAGPTLAQVIQQPPNVNFGN